MREESPVHLQPGLDGETPIWFVTRYDDVVTLLTDNERFVARPEARTHAHRARRSTSPRLHPTNASNENLLAKDGEDHRRLRRLVTKAFTPRIVEQLRPRIQQIADDLIDLVEERGSMELVDDFAFPLPITVIAELLGIPVEDRGAVPRVVEQRRHARADAGVTGRSPSAAGTSSSRTSTICSRNDAPSPTDDLVSALVLAEDGGDTLSENELYSMVVLLIVAGHETTVSLIANAVHTLLTHPEQLAALRADPSLMTSAVEELVRFDSPVERTITRWVAADTELGGQTLRRGDLVIAVIGSANRDAEQFPAPTRSTSRAATTSTSASDAARTTASAHRSRASRPRSRWRRSSAGSRTFASRSPSDDLYWRPIPIFRSLASLPVAWDV